MEPRTLGDYRLLEILEERDGETVWLAEQASVGRPVRLLELTDPSRREPFLADIRARAAVDHPLIASIYEAVDGDPCFAVLERIPGNSLADRLHAREAMRPADLAHILRRTAEAMLQLRSGGCSTRPLSAAAIHFDPHGVVRLANLVRAGSPDPDEERTEITALGRELPPLVADGLPGASRIITVLAWMRGEGIGKPLDWEAVRAYCEQIEDQLRSTAPATDGPRTQPAPRKSRLPAVLGALAGLALLVIAATILFRQTDPELPVALPTLPEPVLIAAGTHPTPDGGMVELPAFEIDACEVTIGEYLKFLQVLDRLGPQERTVFDAEDQPAGKTGHEPDDWEAMLAAAREGGEWNGRPIDLFCPVVNIDWWDATAYCAWNGSRLPTQEEWFAALRSGASRPEALEPAGWGPVTAIGTSDRTPNGLRGMAGSVAEWTREPVIHPANPLGARRHVLMGGSHQRPANGALTREWTDDRLLRRPDLGFRTVADPR